MIVAPETSFVKTAAIRGRNTPVGSFPRHGAADTKVAAHAAALLFLRLGQSWSSQPLLEEALLGFRVDEFECALIGRARVVDAIQPAQQLRSRCMQVVVLVEHHAMGMMADFQVVR